ncbi:hypothetical protein OAK51_04690 [Alphaproteobacteria bacterium]|nr:hypothetical protein [Alphaproteobacteria bacterium]
MEEIRDKVLKNKFAIKDIEIFALNIPLKKPIKMAGITVESAENIFVKIISNNNLYGWGEASSAPTMTGEFVEGMYAASKFIKNQLIGLKFNNFFDINTLKRLPIYQNKGTLSAFEMALIDLILKEEKTSFQNFFGLKERNNISIIQMIAGSDLDEEISNVKKAVRNGFNCFKIKVGSSNNYKYDLERCTKIISSVNSSCKFSADANEGYNNEDALNFALEAKNCGLKFFEQPIPSKDLDFMNTITRQSSVPICSDEGVHSKEDIKNIINNRTSNGISLKTIKLGGIVEVLNCAFLASNNGIAINLAGKVAETSISSYAIANIATSIPQMNWDLSITNQYLIEDPVLVPLDIHNGKVHMTETIGLGTEIDMNKAKKYITSN